MARHPNKRAAALTITALAAVAVAVALVPGAEAAQCTPDTNPARGPSDVVAVWSLACDAPQNQNCPSCLLWNKAGDPKFKSLPYIYSGSASGVNRAKLLPTRPLPGIESAVRDNKDTSSYWTSAIADAQKGNIKTTPAVPATKYPIVFINSINARAQHQWHLHVGGPQAGYDEFYKCAKKIILAPPKVGQWTDKTFYDAKSQACQNLKVHRDVVIYATSSPGDKISSAISYGFKHVVKEAKSQDITKDLALQHTGVLVQPSKNAGEYLVFLITNTNDEKIYGNRT